jgi:DMSO reductase family type II enzyme heme b subunit
MGTIVAPALSGPLPDGPQAPEWNQSRSVYVALTPLWWTDERIEGLLVQALHNEKEVAFRLSWIDASDDTRAVRQDEFRDGVAIQFSLSPDPPFYMGSAGPKGGVNIWYWKADHQKDLTAGRQDVRDAHPNQVVDQYQQYEDKPTADSGTQGADQAVLHSYLTYLTAWAAGNLVANPTLKTSVESLVAHGPGSLSGKPPNIQLVEGKAIFERGVWTVQMQRNLDLLSANVTDTDQRVFKPGDYLPVSFAVWNGSAGDRDGKKNISIWQKLVIE